MVQVASVIVSTREDVLDGPSEKKADFVFFWNLTGNKFMEMMINIWAIYNDLSRGHPKWWFSKGSVPQNGLRLG